MKKPYIIWIIRFLLLLVLSGCGKNIEPSASPQKPDAAGPTQTSIITAVPVTPTPASDEGAPHSVTILYTNDEHGWMEGVGEGMGAANLMSVWEQDFGYSQDGPFILLSGGDMWTGPAVSTWFEGYSMVQVMNLMGYQAAAVGNHEFDFGLEKLRLQSLEMKFPLLSANIRYKAGGAVPSDIGIQPFAIIERGGIKFGVVGLTTRVTPTTTLPDVVAPFDFIDYETALREFVPQARAAGAEVIVVPAHICRGELSGLARAVADLGISMMGGGHCNDYFSMVIDDTVILGGGAHMESFAWAQLELQAESGVVEIIDHGIAGNRPEVPQPEVAALVGEWQAEANLILDEVIGYTNQMIPRNSSTMRQMIVESWLLAYPSADIAMTNHGGIRADIKAGEVTFGDVVSVLPFSNTIIELHLRGEDLARLLIGRRQNTAIAGIDFISGEWVLENSGEPLAPDELYVVLVNSFMYAGGDGYEFSDYDSQGYDTTIHYRQPLLDWLAAQHSSQADPLDTAIDELIDK